MTDHDPFKSRSAELLLSLYNSRREPALRAARDWWVVKFHPTSAKEILKLWGSSQSGPYRMVTTHWEMAASFVTLGAIDAEMFHAANTEHFAVYAKLRPFLADIRQLATYPDYMSHLERLVTTLPDFEARMMPIERYLARRAAESATA